MTRECECEPDASPFQRIWAQLSQLYSLAYAAERRGREREREACAKDVEQLLKYYYDFCAHNYNTKEVAEHTAKQIRARGVAQEE